MQPAFFVLIVAANIAVIGLIIWAVRAAEKKRTEAFCVSASELGLEFSAEKNDALLEKMQIFTLFNKGHSRKMKNVMTALTDVAQMSIFDYQFTTGGGQSSHTHAHTVVAMESDSLLLASFAMHPERFFHKIGAKLGMQDIDFDSHPDFSSSFLLGGDDEEAIRELFDSTLLDFFTTRTGISVEAKTGIFIYRRAKRVKPQEVHALMDEAFQVYAALVQRLSQ